jgi:hypothetical protein
MALRAHLAAMGGLRLVACGGAVWFGSQHGEVWRWAGADRAVRVATVPSLTSLLLGGGCH